MYMHMYMYYMHALKESQLSSVENGFNSADTQWVTISGPSTKLT